MNNRRVVLVTGSSRGIGQGIALAFAKAGYDVAIHYSTSKEQANETYEKVLACGVHACLLHGDVADANVPSALVSETIERLGRLDVFVANAGFFRKDSLSDLTAERMDIMYRTNFRGMILGAQAAAAFFMENKIPGCILINTSVRAYCAHVDDTIYGALKAGMNRIIKSFAMDLGPYGIRVNGFAPGVINVTCPDDEASDPFYANTHRYIPLRRNGYADDIGDAVAFLASDAARYITGTTLQIDGGLSCIGAPEDILGVRQAFDLSGFLKEE